MGAWIAAWRCTMHGCKSVPYMVAPPPPAGTARHVSIVARLDGVTKQH